MAERRLSSADRRAQLVSIAREVIAAEGTDALTLAHLATKAGISKPVVYDHFSSRSALLLSLYEDFDHRQLADLRAATALPSSDLRQQVDAIAAAHVTCMVSQGTELSGVMAALEGTPDLEKARRDSEHRYVEICREAIHRADATADLNEQSAIAFVGAADALGHAAARGTITPAVARATITTVLLALVAGGRPLSPVG
ncbi:TetR/AcrR family transcriptional regulator [Kribbella sp. DT2]|uniref:TetR/AcrR family transcriptional regulator n=1 Tax=Kribbella sp. DT2 TaxID=3393427 RepID=UPI003CED155D